MVTLLGAAAGWAAIVAIAVAAQRPAPPVAASWATRLAPAAAQPPPAVVFDTDMDFDDAAALAYLAAQHKAGSIRLRAVTVENNGAGTVGLAGAHARCLLDRFGLREVPVAQGPSGTPVFPSLSASVAGIMATLIPSCPRLSLPDDPGAGASLLARVAREESDLRVFATGPMTNLARALRREPALRDADLVAVNGGDIGAKANPLLDEGLLRDGTQDFNFSADPAAARGVVAAGLWPLLLVTRVGNRRRPHVAGIRRPPEQRGAHDRGTLRRVDRKPRRSSCSASS